MSDFDKRFPPVPPVPPVPPPSPVPPHRHYPHPKPFPHRHRKPLNHEADFAPMIMHPHIPHHFNFWCNKVIPLVYDDSLSYYEVLAKTVDYLNHVINDVKMGAINIEELAEAFCELQRFVNDYFAWYQSKGLINYEIAITNDNYEKYLPDLDVAQMNTVYRFKFVAGSEQTLPDNLPDAAKPFSGAECVLFNLSNFQLKRVGNEWCEITNDDKDYSTANNYQLFITDKDIYFRENSGDSWGEWSSIFANWWESEFENVKTWVREYVTPLITDLNTRLTAEIERATAAEQVLDGKIDAETARATAAEQGLSQRLVAEYERASAKENELEQAIEDETDRAEAVEGNLQTAIQNEVTRATGAESAIQAALNNEITRATGAESAIQTALNNEVSRATARENQISGAISDVATNLSEEILDRQQGDEDLSDSIDAETARATAAETAIRNGYIPNGGNSITSGDDGALNITRNTVTVKSYGTTLSSGVTSGTPNSIVSVMPAQVTLESGANESGIVLTPNSAVITQQTGGTIQFNISGSGATPMSAIFTDSGFHQSFSGGSVNWDSNGGINLNLTNSSSFVIADNIYLTHRVNNAIRNAISMVNYSFILEHSETNNNSLINLTGGTGHLLRNGVSSTSADTEIVIKGDLSAYATNDSVANGYIPNEGNALTTTNLTLTRRIFYLNSNSGFNVSSPLMVFRRATNTLPVINVNANGIVISDGFNSSIDVGFSVSDEITVQSDNMNINNDVLSINTSDHLEIVTADYVTMKYNTSEIFYGDNNGVKIGDGSGTFVDTGVETNGYVELRGSSAIKMSLTSAGNEVLFFNKNASSAHDKYIIRLCGEKLMYNTLNDSMTVFGENSVFATWVLSLNTRARHNMIIANKEFDDVDGTFNYTGTRDVFDVPIIWENCQIELSGNLTFTNGKHIFKNCKFNSDDTQTIRDIFISGTAPVHVEFINCSFYNCRVNVADSYNNGDNTTRFVMDGCYTTSNVNISTTDIGGANVVKRIMNCSLNTLNYTCSVTGAGKDVIVCGNRIVEYHSLGVGDFDTLFWYNNMVLNQ